MLLNVFYSLCKYWKLINSYDVAFHFILKIVFYITLYCIGKQSVKSLDLLDGQLDKIHSQYFSTVIPYRSLIPTIP